MVRFKVPRTLRKAPGITKKMDYRRRKFCMFLGQVQSHGQPGQLVDLQERTARERSVSKCKVQAGMVRSQHGSAWSSWLRWSSGSVKEAEMEIKTVNQKNTETLSRFSEVELGKPNPSWMAGQWGVYSWVHVNGLEAWPLHLSVFLPHSFCHWGSRCSALRNTSMVPIVFCIFPQVPASLASISFQVFNFCSLYSSTAYLPLSESFNFLSLY